MSRLSPLAKREVSEVSVILWVIVGSLASLLAFLAPPIWAWVLGE